jgi:methionyl-tRNA formyltransferase
MRLRVYFLASGVIAVPALAILKASSVIELVGCGTQPDRPQGRKRRLAATPVGSWCAENDIAVDKPACANAPAFVDHVRGCGPHMVVVFAYGQILRNDLLNCAPLGCINLHASLLPQHRGAAPVSAAILAGDQQTGVSVMRMEAGLDTGPVYRRYEQSLSGTETAGELEEELGRLAAACVEDVLPAIADGTLTAAPQDDSRATYARKLNKRDGRIDWSSPAEQIARQVRAYHPWPGAWFDLHSRKRTRRITITAATALPADGRTAPPGTVVEAGKNRWTIACGHDLLGVELVKPEGKRQMTGPEFLRGSPLEPGSRLTNETHHCQP